MKPRRKICAGLVLELWRRVPRCLSFLPLEFLLNLGQGLFNDPNLITRFIKASELHTLFTRLHFEFESGVSAGCGPETATRQSVQPAALPPTRPRTLSSVDSSREMALAAWLDAAADPPNPCIPNLGSRPFPLKIGKSCRIFSLSHRRPGLDAATQYSGSVSGWAGVVCALGPVVENANATAVPRFGEPLAYPKTAGTSTTGFKVTR